MPQESPAVLSRCDASSKGTAAERGVGLMQAQTSSVHLQTRPGPGGHLQSFCCQSWQQLPFPQSLAVSEGSALQALKPLRLSTSCPAACPQAIECSECLNGKACACMGSESCNNAGRDPGDHRQVVSMARRIQICMSAGSTALVSGYATWYAFVKRQQRPMTPGIMMCWI